VEVLLEQAGMAKAKVEYKEESREVIAQWMPGSGAEDYVVSANISAIKPGDGFILPVSTPAQAAPAAQPEG